jgi:hypothetical protein
MARVGREGHGILFLVSKNAGCLSVGVVHEVRASCTKIGLAYQLSKCVDNIPDESKGRREMHNTHLLFEP